MPRQQRILPSQLGPREVGTRAVRKGEQIALPPSSGTGPNVTEPAPDDGVYFETRSGCFFVESRTLWQTLDQLMDGDK